MNPDRHYRVTVVTRLGGARQLYLIPRKGYSYTRGDTGRARMTSGEVEAARRWAKRRAVRQFRVTRGKGWPFLELVKGARWPTNKKLLRRLNETGRQRRRIIRIVSGLRTPFEAWVLRMRFLEGKGNLAARCCSKYDRERHSWADCGKDPWSNHADGNAADCGTISGRTGNYTSLANDAKAAKLARANGLGFPVVSPWEPWHCELR